MLKTTVIVTILFVTLIDLRVNALSCYECSSVRNISDCTNVVQCSTDENCFTDLSGSGDNTRYTVGCRAKQICRQPSSSSQGSLIGRSVSPTLSCSQCCGVDFCNQNICSTSVQGLFTNKCEDDPNFNCAQVSSLFNVCVDKDHAKLVCRRYCGLCDIVDGHWLEWSSWSTCSQTCDNGTILRTRMCNRTEGGLPCSGESSETLHCFIKSCPVNGGWTTWTDWSGCSVTCGAGLERRSRDCSNPPPGPDGKDCVGDNDDIQICMDKLCYDGTWMSWSTWSSCTASCQGGISVRNRQCNTTLSSLGHNCVGNDRELMVCNTQLCPDSVIDGMWSIWSSWTACSPYCMKERTRTCANPPPSMYGKNCLGTSKEITDCNLEYCTNPVRLVNGSDPYEGRLEVFHRGQWGTVCGNNFDDFSAMLVCRMLNYNGISKAYYSAAYGEGTVPTLLSLGHCYGAEMDYEDIFDCQPLVWGQNQCSHAHDVGVSCHPSMDVKLVNGTNKYNGIIMVSIDGGEWRKLCSGIYPTEAEVICRMLGFPTFLSVQNSFKPSDRDNGPRYYNYEFTCFGSEKSLLDCDADMDGYTCASEDNSENGCETDTCSYNSDIGIACGTDFGIRLRNGTNNHNGRVEVSVDGVNWGKICVSALSKQAAKVICKMLGLPTNVTTLFSSSRYGIGPSLYTTYAFECSGWEQSLAQCDIPHDCYRSDSIGVDCSPSLDVRLVNGTNAYSGSVEVSLDGSYWEGICDYNFGMNEARVICKTLGYASHTALAYGNSYFGYSGTTSMLALNCNGTESNIGECHLHGEGSCWRKTVAGVWCSAIPVSARLVNGSTPHDGRLEMSFDSSTWGTVCTNGYSIREARVICRMLGFPSSNAKIINPTQVKGSIVLNDVRCRGDEVHILDCQHDAIQINNCKHNMNIGVSCS